MTARPLPYGMSRGDGPLVRSLGNQVSTRSPSRVPAARARRYDKVAIRKPTPDKHAKHQRATEFKLAPYKLTLQSDTTAIQPSMVVVVATLC